MVVRFNVDFKEWNQLSQDFLDMAKATPPLAREFLNLAGEDGVDIVQLVYATEPSNSWGRRLPLRTTGELGLSFSYQVAAGPKRQWLTIINDASYMSFITHGRGPGGVPIEEIKDWAQVKLGLDPDSRDTKAIINSIRRFGFEGDNLMERALRRGTMGGGMWEQRISGRLDWFTGRLLNTITR